MENFIITKAIEQAKKSKHKHMIGAIIFKGRKKIVSKGYNQAKVLRDVENSETSEQVNCLLAAM